MTLATERVLRQTSETAAFAVVELDVAPRPDAAATTVVVATDAELTEGDYYVRTVEVGILAALDRALKRGVVAVTIRRIVTTAVDSTHAVVLLAAARAARKALGDDPDLAGTLDPSARVVHLRI